MSIYDASWPSKEKPNPVEMLSQFEWIDLPSDTTREQCLFCCGTKPNHDPGCDMARVLAGDYWRPLSFSVEQGRDGGMTIWMGEDAAKSPLLRQNVVLVHGTNAATATVVLPPSAV